MKIYLIDVDVDTYQCIIPDIPEKNSSLLLSSFDCKSLSSDWKDIKWYIDNPKDKKGNFFALSISGALAFDQKVYDSDLFSLLEMAGEILAIKVGKETLYVLNVLECVNCLDDDKTTWNIYPNGNKGRIKEYAFHASRLDESSLFKIPETSRVEILTYSGLKDSTDEFYSLYNKLGFSGLEFELLWSDEK